MTRKQRSRSDLVHALIGELGGVATHGAIVTGACMIDDLDVEISITMTRKIAVDERRFYHDEALDLLKREPWRRCEHSKVNRGPWKISKTSTCYGYLAGVIVYRRTPYHPFGHYGPLPRSYGFDFVCAPHREHPRYAACDIIETIRFTESEREAVRRAYHKHSDAQRERFRDL